MDGARFHALLAGFDGGVELLPGLGDLSYESFGWAPFPIKMVLQFVLHSRHVSWHLSILRQRGLPRATP